MSSGSGGRRESNGRNRTKDPCLGKVALGTSHGDDDDDNDNGGGGGDDDDENGGDDH